MKMSREENKQSEIEALPKTADKECMTMKRCKPEYLKFSDNTSQETLNIFRKRPGRKNQNESTTFKISKATMVTKLCEPELSNSNTLSQQTEPSTFPLPQVQSEPNIYANVVMRPSGERSVGSALSNPRALEYPSMMAPNKNAESFESNCSFQSFHDESFTDYHSSLTDYHSSLSSLSNTGHNNRYETKNIHKQSSVHSPASSKSSDPNRIESNINDFQSDEKNRAMLLLDSDSSSTEGRTDSGKDSKQSHISLVPKSPWGEPHKKVNFPLDFLRRDYQSWTLQGFEEYSDGVADKARYVQSDDIQNSSSPPSHSSPAVNPGQLVFQVYPLFPVYMMNSVQSASAIPATVHAGHVPGTGAAVNVITLPPVGFMQVNENMANVPQDRGHLSGHENKKDRSSRKFNRPAGLGSHDRGSSSSYQREQSGSRPDKILGRRPPTIICYICGREYGSASIGIHEKQCLERWRKQNSELPKKMQKPEPVKPGVFAASDEKRRETEAGERDQISSSGRSNYDLDALNEAAYASAQSQNVKCTKCGRSFLPERLEIHSKACRGYHKIV